MKCCRPPSFSSAIMGRSWADHGQIMGRPSAIDSCRKILKISAFSDAVFFRKIMKICDFRTRLEQSVKLFLQTPLVLTRRSLPCFKGVYDYVESSDFNKLFWALQAEVFPVADHFFVEQRFQTNIHFLGIISSYLFLSSGHKYLLNRESNQVE